MIKSFTKFSYLFEATLNNYNQNFDLEKFWNTGGLSPDSEIYSKYGNTPITFCMDLSNCEDANLESEEYGIYSKLSYEERVCIEIMLKPVANLFLKLNNKKANENLLKWADYLKT